MQRRIPCVLMRGGTSRGPFFLRSDLPDNDDEVDRVLIAAMGSPHPLQVDGIGGGHPLTSKVAIIDRSTMPGVDIDYLFVQVNVETATVDRKPNCGNILSAVGPFSIEAGLVPAQEGETSLVIRNVNTGTVVEEIVQTPGGKVTYEGGTALDGVPGTAAPVRMSFADAVGAVTGSLLPDDGSAISVIDGIETTLIDAATPMIMIRAADVGFDGAESPEEIEAAAEKLARVEELRRKAGIRMGLGDVSGRVVPKVGLISPPRREGGVLCIRYLTPDRCHRSLAVTGAVTVASAIFVQDSIASRLAAPMNGNIARLEHPSGAIEVGVEMDTDPATGRLQVRRTSLIRTARRIFEGNLIVTV